MKVKFEVLTSSEKERFLKKLKERFGFAGRLDYVFIKTKSGKIKIINPEVLKLNIKDLNVENLGLYFARWDGDEVRLSIEGSQIVGKRATKNVLELTEDEAEKWLKGQNVEVGKRSVEDGFVILRFKDDFLGCGRYKDGRIVSFVPKWRRIH